MHLTRITYARLYNLGNYENERLEAEITVGPDEDPQIAFDLAKSIVVEQHAQLKAERADAARRQREEYEERERQRLAELQRQRETLTGQARADADEDLDF